MAVQALRQRDMGTPGQALSGVTRCRRAACEPHCSLPDANAPLYSGRQPIQAGQPSPRPASLCIPAPEALRGCRMHKHSGTPKKKKKNRYTFSASSGSNAAVSVAKAGDPPHSLPGCSGGTPQGSAACYYSPDRIKGPVSIIGPPQDTCAAAARNPLLGRPVRRSTGCERLRK